MIQRHKKQLTDKPTRYYSNLQESAVAKALKGSKTIASGSTPFYKGDVTVDDLLLIECKTKTSQSASISIKKQWLIKNDIEALTMGKKYSALAFNFGPDECNYYIIDEQLFIQLIEYIKEIRES